jgi:5'-nucleotidase
MQKRLLIDMDDVLADATGKILEYYEKTFGEKIPRERLNGKSLRELFPDKVEKIREFPRQKGFFRELEVIADSQKVVRELCDQYEVFIVSAAMEFPDSLKEKYEWMQEHFPFVSWKNIVFCGHKYMISADYLIDDHLKNLEPFTGHSILYTAPHNTHIEGYTRVDSWKDVAKLLLS